MKYILEYKSFYKVGDIVLIEYWYNDMVTPVKILEEITKRKLRISHDIKESEIRNAPDEVVKSTQVIDLYKTTK
jgi:hypothetical protein